MTVDTHRDSHYRAAIVGLGNVAWKMGNKEKAGDSLSHAAAFQANPFTRLVAGCSPDADENHAFQQEYGLPVYEDLDQMLQAEQPHIVSVCSPTEYHFEQVCRLIKKKIPMVWLEKPPSETLSQLKQLIALSNEGQKTSVLVNYQRRYSHSYQKLREVIHEKTFGAVRQLEVRYSKGLLINGSHMLDQVFFLLGETGWEIEWVERNSTHDNPRFSLRFENNIKVMVSASALPYHNLDIVVTFDDARLSIIHGGMTTRQEVKCEHELFPGFYRLCDVDECLLGEGGFDYSYDNALKDLLRSHEKAVQPVSNLESALCAQQLIDQVLQAGKQ